MQNIILTPVSVPELVNLIASEVEARINRPEFKDPPQDRISLNEATKITGLQKSALYKMTMAGTIPHEKYGHRLVFSRQTLQQWVQSRTIEKRTPESIISERLTRVAKRRL
jgi:excisionase family DNA binding protein